MRRATLQQDCSGGCTPVSEARHGKNHRRTHDDSWKGHGVSAILSRGNAQRRHHALGESTIIFGLVLEWVRPSSPSFRYLSNPRKQQHPALTNPGGSWLQKEATTFSSLGRKHPQTCGSGFDHSFCSSDPAGAPTCLSENTPAMFPGLCVS